MENNKLSDYVDILEIFINHMNSGSETLLTPKEIKELLHMDTIPSKSKAYEQKKRSLDRCLEFYSLIKLISIKTDTTLNELDRLERIRNNRKAPLEERKQLDPYISHIKEIKRDTLIKDKCKYFNSVGRFKKKYEVWIDGEKNEVDENILKQLPKYKEITVIEDVSNDNNSPKKIKLTDSNNNPLSEYPTDKFEYSIINERMKFKKIEKQRLIFEFFGKKFQNIKLDATKDFNNKNLINDIVRIDDQEIILVNMEDKGVRAEDCRYRLNINDKCNQNNPIQFQIPSNTKKYLFVKFLTKMIDANFTEDGIYEEDITSPMISSVINSNAFSNENKGLIMNTVGKLLVERQNHFNTNKKKDGFYPLTLLIELIESNIKINIEFENYGNLIKLNNTQIKKIVIKENKFDIYFDNFISMNQTNISQIKYISNVDRNYDKHTVDKLIEELENPTYKNTFRCMMSNFSFTDVFEF